MVRAVASEDEEPGRSVLSCASLPGLARDIALPIPAGSAHLLFSSGPDCSKSLSWHICFSHCPAIHSAHPVLLLHGKSTPAPEEANYRKMKPNGRASHCPKHGVTTWRWHRNNGREPHTAWGGKEGPMKRQYRAGLLRFRRVPPVKCTSRMRTRLGCPAVATDVRVWG